MIVEKLKYFEVDKKSERISTFCARLADFNPEHSRPVDDKFYISHHHEDHESREGLRAPIMMRSEKEALKLS